MREAFTVWSPRGETAAVVDQANSICREYRGQGYDLTLRQLYYQFVARGLIPNNQRSYKRLGDIVNNARMSGLLDWSYIVDRTRNLSALPRWETPDSIIRSAADGYAIDKRADQEVYVEVWVEKEALAGVVSRSARAVDVPHFSCRGYVSQSEQHAAGRRFKRRIEAGQKVVIIHLGDHDPSGIDMTRDINDRISRFLTVGLGYVSAEDPLDADWDRNVLADEAVTGADRLRDFEYFPTAPVFSVHRIALNQEQVEFYKPPPNPTKITDSRAKGYIKRFGRESWELDALDPRTLDNLITAEIEAWTIPGRYDDLMEREEDERSHLIEIADHYEELTWPGQ